MADILYANIVRLNTDTELALLKVNFDQEIVKMQRALLSGLKHTEDIPIRKRVEMLQDMRQAVLDEMVRREMIPQ